MFGQIQTDGFRTVIHTNLCKDAYDSDTNQCSDYCDGNCDTDTCQLCQKQMHISEYKSILKRAALLIDDFQIIRFAIPPQIPPIPWHPNASNASSIFSFCLISFTPKKQIGLTNAPMINADQIGTKPAPGVIATNQQLNQWMHQPVSFSYP